MSDKATRPGRRNFLLAVGAGGAVTAAAIAVKTVASGTAPAASDDDKRHGKGYQETAHVRNYYRTTQV